MITSTEYANNNDTICPGCNSTHVNSTGDHEYTGEEIIKDVYCEDCGATWQEIYTITGYRCFKPAPLPDQIVGTNRKGETIYITPGGTRYYFREQTTRGGKTETLRSAGMYIDNITDENRPLMKLLFGDYFTIAELA